MKTCTKAKLWLIALIATVSFLTWCNYTDGDFDNLWGAFLGAWFFIALIALCVIFGESPDNRKR